MGWPVLDIAVCGVCLHALKIYWEHFAGLGGQCNCPVGCGVPTPLRLWGGGEHTHGRGHNKRTRPFAGI